MTALGEDEILVEIEFGLASPRSGFAFTEYARRPGDFAFAGCAAALSLLRDGSCASASIALLGAGPTPLRARESEEYLAGQQLTNAVVIEATALAIADLSPSADIHASAAFRRRLIRELTRRSLLEAARRAQERVEEEDP
jgi:CO/xanthine dehydrogenase FAD-binding subunit